MVKLLPQFLLLFGKIAIYFGKDMPVALFTCIFLYIQDIPYSYVERIQYMVLTAVLTSHNSSKLSHRNAALSDCTVMLKTKQNKTLPWEPSNISAPTIRKHI